MWCAGNVPLTTFEWKDFCGNHRKQHWFRVWASSSCILSHFESAFLFMTFCPKNVRRSSSPFQWPFDLGLLSIARRAIIYRRIYGIFKNITLTIALSVTWTCDLRQNEAAEKLRISMEKGGSDTTLSRQSHSSNTGQQVVRMRLNSSRPRNNLVAAEMRVHFLTVCLQMHWAFIKI